MNYTKTDLNRAKKLEKSFGVVPLKDLKFLASHFQVISKIKLKTATTQKLVKSLALYFCILTKADIAKSFNKARDEKN